MTDSPIFIVGNPRSGTGLLRDLLRSHPHLSFPGESHFLPVFYRAFGDPNNEREAIRLASMILESGWVKSWNLDLSPADFAQDRTYRDVVSRVYETLMRREGKVRWGDKTPQYLAAMPTIVELFPNARFVHIIRDGRDVALSWLRAHFGPENIYVAARSWSRTLDHGIRFGRALPGTQYLEVRYESLLSDTASTMRTICDFLGEPFIEDVTRPTFMQRLNRESIIGQRQRTWIAEDQVVATNTCKWKHALTIPQRSLFESVAGDMLELLGYETEGLSRPVSAPERIYWFAHHTVRHAYERLNTKDHWPKTAIHMTRARLRARRRKTRCTA